MSSKIKALPLGPIFEWGYDNQEANDKRIIEIADKYGYQGGVGGVDALDALLHLQHLAPEGYCVRREDGMFGVWLDDEEEPEGE